jgi:hypothetical protein
VINIEVGKNAVIWLASLAQLLRARLLSFIIQQSSIINLRFWWRVGRKPGSVYAAICLRQPLPAGLCGTPRDGRAGRVTRERDIPRLPCTGRVCLSRRVATPLVGSYPTVSPLPADSLSGI